MASLLKKLRYPDELESGVVLEVMQAKGMSQESLLVEMVKINPSLFQLRDFKTCFTFSLLRLAFCLDNAFHFQLEENREHREQLARLLVQLVR